MKSLIDVYEVIAAQVAAEIKKLVEVSIDQLGDRPFKQSYMNDKLKLEAYNRLREAPGGLYNFAEGMRQEMERRLQGIDIDTRLAKNLGTEQIRKTAYILTLDYASDMKRLSDKLGVPLVERELIFPPAPEEIGIAEWPISGIGSMESSMMPPEAVPMAEPPLDLSFPPPPLQAEPMPLLEPSIP